MASENFCDMVDGVVYHTVLQYDKKYNGSPKWRRLRNHLDSLGIKVFDNTKTVRIRYCNDMNPTFFNTHITGEKSLNELFNEAVISFEDKEFNTSKSKLKFGNSVNDIFTKLGASQKEIAAYWDIPEKRFISAFEFHNTIKFINMKISEYKDLAPILDMINLSIETNNIHSIRSIMNFLPKNDLAAMSLLKAFVSINQ